MGLTRQQREAYQTIKDWSLDSTSFVIGPYGVPKLSQQQLALCKDYDLMNRAKALDYDLRTGVKEDTIIERFGTCEMTDQEKEYASKYGISVRSGKGCLAWGTPIIKYNGDIVESQDVKVGDVLMGPDSTPKVVTQLFGGRQTMYRVEYNNGESYEVNEDHILSLMATGTKKGYKTGEITNVPLKEYLKWDKTKKLCHAGYRVPVEKFGCDELKLSKYFDPYLIGLWLGDGDKNGTSLVNIDKEVVDHIKWYASKHRFKYKNRIVKEHVLSYMHSRNNPLLDLLRDLGIWRNKHIPKKLLTANKSIRLELLAGLIDSDGHLDKRNRRTFEITQKREHLAKDIQFLCRSLGLRCNIKEKHIKGYGIYYRMCIGGNTQIIPCKVKRKQALPGNPKTLTMGIKVTKLEEDNYYGFSLYGPDKRFLLGDFTVTHNTGKDAVAAMLIPHFLLCYKGARVICTAPTEKQLKTVLWVEISKWLNEIDADGKQRVSVKDWFGWQSERFFLTQAPTQSFAFWKTAPQQAEGYQAGSFLGSHSDNMLIVLDEASAIPDFVIEPLMSTLTGRRNWILQIFNPIRSGGYAYESQVGKYRHMWVRHHWNAEDSDIVSPAHIEREKAAHGEDSDYYRINVKGEFPVISDDCVIPRNWAEAAIGRDLEPGEDAKVITAVDVARHGGDDSVILTKIGPKVARIRTFRKVDSLTIAGYITEEIEYMESNVCLIDATGLGWGVYDQLKRSTGNCKLKPVEVAKSATDITKFEKLRDELWWKCRQDFEDGTIGIPAFEEQEIKREKIEDMINELSQVKYEVKPNGKIKIESKKEMKRRLGSDASPNLADALVLTYMEKPQKTRTRKDPYEETYEIQQRITENSWLSA